MMIEPQSLDTPQTRSKPGRFLLLQAAIGAVVGGGTTLAVLALIEGRVEVFDDPQRLVALMTGLVLAVMALLVGFGAAAPGPGSKLLNVEDSGELRERRSELGIGAILVALAAAILLVLSLTAVGGSGGLLPASVAIVIAGVCFATLGIVGFLTRNQSDEMERDLSIKSGALAFNLSFLVFGGWGILSYLGYAPWIGPLGLLAGLLVVYLVAIGWVVHRRGLLDR